MKKAKVFQLALAAALPITALAGNDLTGPDSSQSPYLIPARNGVVTASLLSAGDAVNYRPDGVTPYRMVGLPDGLGAFDNGDGTFTLLMNHELGNTVGAVRAHGGTGSFVSRWVIDKESLEVLNIQDLNSAYVTYTDGAGTSNTFNRFCSADLPPVPAFFNPLTGNGSQLHIFMGGEESSPPFSGFGRAIANVVDASGPGTGIGYELPAFNGLGAWENLLAHPNTGNVLGDKTIVMANSDGARNSVYLYVGTKTSAGTGADKAGLTGGTLYALGASSVGSGVEDRNTPASGTFSFSAIVRDGSGSVTGGDTGTQFLRPEDGAWDPKNPSDYYFVTTDRFDQTKDGVGANIGRSRLYRLRFTDITHPELGGTITCLLNGTEAGQMFDNMTITPRGSIFLQEDVGNQAHNGKIWRYSIKKGTLELVAMHDPARFGNIGLAATASFSQDEESSGIISLENVLGEGWLLCDVQAHYNIGDSELVEGGQLVLIHFPPGQEK
jgi:hypothetical protein